jgi:hypothetical protein
MSRNSLTLEYHETRIERRVKRRRKWGFEDGATEREVLSYKRPDTVGERRLKSHQLS